jgi:hypothetical protein
MSTAHYPSKANSFASSRPALGRVGLLLTTLVLLLATPAVQPSPAVAGSYDVYTCTQPNGAPAPVDGWTPFTTNVNMVAEDECAQGGWLAAGMLGWKEIPVAAESGWTFRPPAGSRIIHATLHWDYNNSDNESTGTATAFESLEAPYRGSRPFKNCVHSEGCCCSGPFSGRVSEQNLVTVPEEDLQPPEEEHGPRAPAGITMVAGCENPDGGGEHCEGAALKYAGVALMSMATITLEDDSPPQITVVGGTLTSGTELEGTQTVAITGTDSGSGIYQAVLEVDGKEAQRTTVDSNGGHCENVGQTTDGRPAFLYVVPCALEVNDQYVSFNLAGISDGPHRLTVLVTDAAGNATTVLNREVIVGRGACNGTCDDQAKLTTSDAKSLKPITRGYSRSALKLSGALREPTGSPVPGAQLELLQQASYTGAPLRTVSTTTTNAAGEWTLAVPRGPSRVLLVAWRSHALDAGYASQLEYHERVFADIALAAPRRVRIGASFTFRGELAGGYIPPEHSIIQMEIFFDSRWRTIETLRTNSRGRFAYGYTFSTGSGSAYLFRAVIRYSHAYPFLAATSRTVRVWVR